MIPQQAQIEQITGQPVRDARRLSGGMIGEVYKVTLRDGQELVAKVSRSAQSTLDIEGRMLTYLTEHSELPVPEVIHNETALLLMTFIPNNGGLRQRSVQEDAAQHLAALHNVTAPQYGLDFDTLIGSLHQPNPRSDSWIAFFREQRLLYMAQVAHKAGRLSREHTQRIETLAGKLERFLQEPQQPSLIHGDMWSGNILAYNGKISGFVDPAIYYADPEIELAFSTLFGSFNEAFFSAYQALRPVQPGFFEERRDLYNLYPLLVHVRLFGGSYVYHVESILKQFGC